MELYSKTANGTEQKVFTDDAGQVIAYSVVGETVTSYVVQPPEELANFGVNGSWQRMGQAAALNQYADIAVEEFDRRASSR